MTANYNIKQFPRDVYGELADDHNHKPSKVWPTLAAGVSVASDAAAWTLGSFVEVMAADDEPADFDIHFVKVESMDDNTVYELVLYYGADDIECARVRFVKDATSWTGDVPCQTPVIPGGSRIRAKCASALAEVSTPVISLQYHTY